MVPAGLGFDARVPNFILIPRNFAADLLRVYVVGKLCHNGGILHPWAGPRSDLGHNSLNVMGVERGLIDRLIGKILLRPAHGAIPFPLRLTVCGLFDAPSVMVTVAAYAAAALGENVKLMLHELWPFKLVPQVVADFVKFVGFVPPMLIDEILTAALVLFVRLTLLAALVEP
jgi:hypothetical protein